MRTATAYVVSGTAMKDAVNPEGSGGRLGSGPSSDEEV
jgi:hypothetical protein